MYNFIKFEFEDLAHGYLIPELHVFISAIYQFNVETFLILIAVLKVLWDYKNLTFSQSNDLNSYLKFSVFHLGALIALSSKKNGVIRNLCYELYKQSK